MKKRVTGAAILVAIGVGIWLSNLFKGLGAGGDGTNVALNSETYTSVESSERSGRSDGTLSKLSPGVETEPAIPTVLIDERQFYLESADDAAAELIPADVASIVSLVEQTQPNALGIRVQIKRRRSSRPSAETALDEALRKAGVTEDQILRHREFVD